MELHLELNFQPAQIPWPEPDCEMGRTDRTPSLTGHLCFLLSPSSRPPPDPLNVTLEFTAELDPGKQQNRLWFSASGKKAVQQLALTQRRKCIPLNISVQDCMEDFLNPVKFLLEYCIQDDAGAGPPRVQPAFRHKCVQGLSWMDSNQVEYQVINCTVDQLSDRAAPTLVLRGQLDINGRNKDKMRKYELRTSGIMDFDRRRYYQGEEGAEGETLLRAHIVTVIEPLVEVDSLPYIVGGTAGGFVILLLVGIVFYKVGFFKRKYRDIMKDGCQDNQCNEPLNQPAPPPTET
ncbi:uncharacterized protein LOC132382721 [Hypanus sabinus]|uniref:uncharacterized protein LOC132382718 n=1 Tax=Hypanus sabinus TaxID=79690 RepID=UPI0028C3926B|nr:uncharacterized protein LOC132382718 [Hypanus sabinus]XP_059809155.1 uncharacterized protein LOC132382721 [Hypanus sabinus]